MLLHWPGPLCCCAAGSYVDLCLLLLTIPHPLSRPLACSLQQCGFEHPRPLLPRGRASVDYSNAGCRPGYASAPAVPTPLGGGGLVSRPGSARLVSPFAAVEVQQSAPHSCLSLDDWEDILPAEMATQRPSSQLASLPELEPLPAAQDQWRLQQQQRLLQDQANRLRMAAAVADPSLAFKSCLF